MKRRGLGLGTRLLLFSSVLLAIPWLGYRYIGEMKEFLLSGQIEAQLLAVRAVATVLHDRSDLFDASRRALNGSPEDSALYVYPLDFAIQLDGYASDWGALTNRSRRYGTESLLFQRADPAADPPAFSLVLGERDAHIHGLLRVADAERVYRHPQYRRLDNADHVRLVLIAPDGDLRRLVLVTEGQGAITAYEVQENWQEPVSGQALFKFDGVWRERSGGYDLEFRFPLDWLGPEQRLLLQVVDVDDPGERRVDAIAATLPKQWSGTLNRLILRSPELERILRGLGRADAGICVVDRHRRVRAVLAGRQATGSPCSAADIISEDLVRDALSGEQQVVLRHVAPGAETLIVAAHPIYAGATVIGAVLLEKSHEHILDLQRDALFQVGLATFLVLLLVVTGLLLFAAWLAWRIRRLKSEAACAIDGEGRVLRATLQSDRLAADDLGDLSRGMSGLLARLQRYTEFLETVPRTLRHEILNPVNTIGLSLQRLADAGNPAGDDSIRTARQAARQLERIVNSLTEAAHIDGALEEAEAGVFDFAALVREYVANSCALHPGRELVYEGPDSGVRVQGSDLRIVQLLDKIKDNALDFSPAGAPIRFELTAGAGRVRLDILNQGPPIPDAVLRVLFVGMASHRPHTDGHPHLGIGLYIARRIARYHGGDLRVCNRDEVSGVRVSLSLPRLASR